MRRLGAILSLATLAAVALVPSGAATTAVAAFGTVFRTFENFGGALPTHHDCADEAELVITVDLANERDTLTNAGGSCAPSWSTGVGCSVIPANDTIHCRGDGDDTFRMWLEADGDLTFFWESPVHLETMRGKLTRMDV